MNAIQIWKKAQGRRVRLPHCQSKSTCMVIKDFLNQLDEVEASSDNWEIAPKKNTFVREGVSFKTILANHYIGDNLTLVEFCAPFIPGKTRMFGDLQNVKNAKITVEYEEE
jgi:hypothetical protein